MESRRENNNEKRRRKIMAHPRISTFRKTRTSDECKLHASTHGPIIMEGRLNGKSPPVKDSQSKNIYVCSNCGNTLFEAAFQFDAGCGFPSFWQQSGGVKEKLLETYGRTRIQLLCSQCNQHLGHLFNHKQTPTGVRYCINATAISCVTQQG